MKTNKVSDRAFPQDGEEADSFAVKAAIAQFAKADNANTQEASRRKASTNGRLSCKQDVEECEDYEIVCAMMKPILLPMKLLGLYHEKKDHVLWKIYGLLVLVILWVNSIKFFAVYSVFSGGQETFNAVFVIKIISSIWQTIVAIESTIIFINHEVGSREALLVRRFNLLFQHHSNPKKEIKRFRKRIFLFLAICSFISVVNIAAIVLSFFGPAELRSAYSALLAPFQNSDWAMNSVPYRVLICVMGSFTVLAWIFNIGYYACHCRLMVVLLADFDKSFRRFIERHKIIPKDANNLFTRERTTLGMDTTLRREEKTLVSEDQFELYRVWHLKLCSLVRTLNVCYQEFIAFTLIAYVPVAFLLLYIMSDWNGNCVTGVMQGLYPMWLVSAIGILLIVVMVAATVNTLAHEPIKYIFNVEIGDFSQSLIFKINLMIDRLTDDPTGLTTWNIFIINKGFLITVAGTILTYFLVVIRFKTTGNSCL